MENFVIFYVFLGILTSILILISKLTIGEKITWIIISILIPFGFLLYFKFGNSNSTNNNSAPMLDFDGVILKSITNHSDSKSHTYDTGSYTTYGNTTYKNTNSYKTTNYYIKFIFQNNKDYPIDIKLRFNHYEQIIRNNDGTYKETYKDRPEESLVKLPPNEAGRINLSINGDRKNRQITLESVFIKASGLSNWEEYSANIAVKK